jgi:hypothetical protein
LMWQAHGKVARAPLQLTFPADVAERWFLTRVLPTRNWNIFRNGLPYNF